MSKIDAEKLELEAVPFDPWGTVEEVGTLLAEAAQRKGLELGCHMDCAVPAIVRGDPAHLRRALTNLVANAVKFTAQGEIWLRVTIKGETHDKVLLRFDVTDTGIGLSTELQERLFRPFAQSEASTARQYGETGLGLAISKKLVTLMGGEIGVTSRPGEGSTFWFTAWVERERASTTGFPGRLEDERNPLEYRPRGTAV